MTTFTTIGKALERNAEMQREKAVEHRDDPRYPQAAKILDGLAAQFAAGDVDPELWARYEAIDPDEDEIGGVIGSIGFDFWPTKADEFVSKIIELAGENRA